MSYLTIDVSTTVANSTDVNAATSLTKQEFLVSPALSVQSSRTWEDIVDPLEKTTIVDCKRALSTDATSQFQILMPRADEPLRWRLRYTGTGTNPVLRTARALSLDATSSVKIDPVSTMIARISTDAGTALSSTAVVVGDSMLIERTTDTFTSLFNDENQGIPCVVTGKGAGYIEVNHNGAFVAESIVLGTDYAEAIRVFSTGPVVTGDILELASPFNFGNLGRYTIVLIRNDYLEFDVTTDMVPETLISLTTNSLKIYDRYVNALSLITTADVWLYVDGAAIMVSPVDASGGVAVLTLRATKLEVENLDDAAVTVSALYSTLAGSC